MKQFKAAITLLFVLPFLFFGAGCKKSKLPQVYFSSSLASVNANGTATVKITLSEPSDNVVGVGFQSIGASKIDFGTSSTSFMHDDSDKMQATIDANGFIDSAGHIQITPGASGVVVTFAQKGDDFPHAAANFEIKMVSVQNATIRQNSNTYTYNINSSSVTEQFASNIVFTDTANSILGGYSLSSYTYTPSGSNYNLTLNYSPVAGGTGPPLSITYSNIAPFVLGSDTLSCNNTSINVTIGYSPSAVNLSCSNFSSSLAVLPVMNTTTPSVYGYYYVFNNGNPPVANLRIAAPNYLITGSLSSPFIYYTP